MQLDDGVTEYRNGDPDIVVLGSSHARTFLAVADLVKARTGGRIVTQIVPVEWGTFGAFNWVLQHRLRPLIEEQDRAGRRRRTRLRRVILVTTYYDLCSAERTGGETGLPMWAWHLSDFLEDFRQHNLTDHNRIYVLSRWRALWHISALVSDRSYGKLGLLVDRFRPGSPPPDTIAMRREWMSRLTRFMEEDIGHCNDVTAKRQLTEMLDYFRARNLDVTVVSFPLDPALITVSNRDGTLRQYADYIRSIEPKYRFRNLDLTLDSPMVDEDFQADLDHVRPERRLKFAEWALDRHLQFLAEPPDSGVRRGAAGVP